MAGVAYTTFTELSAGLGRSKGLVTEHVSFGQATRQDTRRCCSKKAAAWRSLRRLVAWLLGGRGGPRSTRYNGQFTRLPQSRCPTLVLGSRLGISITGGPGTRLAHCGHQGELDRPGGSCFSPRVTRSKRSMQRRPTRRMGEGSMPGVGTLSPRLASTTASIAGRLLEPLLSKW